MQTCNQQCWFCGREFFRWWKSREAQMSVPRGAKKDKDGRIVRPTETQAFANEVQTSRDKAPVSEGERVRWKHFEGTVHHVPSYRGIDGIWRATIEFDSSLGHKTSEKWTQTINAEELTTLAPTIQE